jgi:hypothetical protein
VEGIKLVEGRQQDVSQNRDKQVQVIHLIQVAAIYLFIHSTTIEGEKSEFIESYYS